MLQSETATSRSAALHEMTELGYRNSCDAIMK